MEEKSNSNQLSEIIRMLDDKDEKVRVNAANLLATFGEAALPGLVKALSNEHFRVRRSAISSISEIGGNEVFIPLVDCLKDPENWVRYDATRSLADLFGSDALEVILPMLEDKHNYVRGGAIFSLRKISDKKAVPFLVKCLTDSDSYVRSYAAQALGELGDPYAVEFLIIALKDENFHVRKDTAYALSLLKDKRAVQPLIAALYDEYEVRFRAAVALREIGDKSALPILEEIYNSITATDPFLADTVFKSLVGLAIDKINENNPSFEG